MLPQKEVQMCSSTFVVGVVLHLPGGEEVKACRKKEDKVGYETQRVHHHASNARPQQSYRDTRC